MKTVSQIIFGGLFLLKIILVYIGIGITILLTLFFIVLFTLYFKQWFNALQQVQHIIY
jgi:hypothetical protein